MNYKKRLIKNLNNQHSQTPIPCAYYTRTAQEYRRKKYQVLADIGVNSFFDENHTLKNTRMGIWGNQLLAVFRAWIGTISPKNPP